MKLHNLYEEVLNEEIHWVSVHVLWEKYKDSSWNTNGVKTTLEMISNGNCDPNDENVRVILYWANKYKTEGVNKNDYIILTNDGKNDLLDGYHRLTAAIISGIDKLPVIYDSSNFKQI